MSDLISRNRAISILEQLEEHSLSGKMDISNAIYLLKNQPTAYDLDKVVEELEILMKDLNVIEIISHIDFDSTIQSSLNNFLKSFSNKAIEIVKADVKEDGTIRPMWLEEMAEQLKAGGENENT